MLDTNIDKIIGIEARVSDKTENSQKLLLIRACNIYVFNNMRIYSELEEQTFDVLNSNNGYGVLDIEFVFANNIVKKMYPEFYTKCFVIRTDTGALIKPMKCTDMPSNSKVNQNGELVVGISYYFRNEEEVGKVLTCTHLLVEGFIALGNPRNVFGVMCQLKMGKNKWKITSAYTYKPKYAKNIRALID